MVEEVKVTKEMSYPAEAFAQDASEPANAAFDEVHAARKLQDGKASNKIADAIQAEFPQVEVFGDSKKEKSPAKSETYKGSDNIDMKELNVKLGLGKEVAPAPLNRTEALLARGLNSAIDQKDLEGIHNALGALAEQTPHTAARILQHIRMEQEQVTPLRQVGFVTGLDQNSNPYVRMTITQANGFGKGAGSTDIAFDSNGVSTATHRGNALRAPESIPVTSALKMIQMKAEPELRHFEKWNRK
jgi:hypothetical protein